MSALPGVTIETELYRASGSTSTDHEFFGIAAHTVLEPWPPVTALGRRLSAVRVKPDPP
ncbi:hypothetical protein OG523_04665 [Streptomyces virginiae]|uniref:hypothetical protein n=1 Tax=Streptomyces virginiae TaxID=1961 RepID=UPI002E33D644|nr:hypothetical protein [Streptomyces virginiae]